LFLINHLDILNEQIVIFEVNFSSIETSLDFSNIRKAFRNIFSGNNRWFSLSRENAFYVFISEASPRIISSEVNYKKDMEKLLDITIYDFANDVTRNITSDITTFVTQCNAYNSISKDKNGNENHLLDQTFANPENLKKMLEQFFKKLEEICPLIFSKISIFIENRALEEQINQKN